MQLEVLDAGMQGWRLNDMHAHVGGQSWKASGMSDHGLQGGEHREEAKMATEKVGTEMGERVAVADVRGAQM